MTERAGFRSTRSQSIVLSSYSSECFFESALTPLRLFAAIDGTKGGVPSLQIKFPGKICNLDIFFYYPNYFNISTNKIEPNSEILFKLGRILIERKPEENTITCLSKGKKPIQLTGVNPKCPKGTKLKK